MSSNSFSPTTIPFPALFFEAYAILFFFEQNTFRILFKSMLANTIRTIEANAAILAILRK